MNPGVYMKKIALLLVLVLLFSGCSLEQSHEAQIVATTRPVYEFTVRLCEGTNLSVSLLVTENVSCLHDYTLQVRQMRAVTAASLVVLSGYGLEDFMLDVLDKSNTVCDASVGISLLHGEEGHEHSHEDDPHIWLSPENAAAMVKNICACLIRQYPEYEKVFSKNLASLLQDLEALQAYGEASLSHLKCRQIITFHDGFSYFAESFDLTILRAIEEESGSEASAGELIALSALVTDYQLPAIFTEANGSAAAASIIAAETGVRVFSLDMGMGERGYFEAMYHNIDTIREALG